MAALSNTIYIGNQETPDFEFDNASISKVSGVFGVDIVGNELTIDTVTAVVRYTGAGNIRGIAYGTPAWWYNDGNLRCAAYVRSVEKVGQYMYRLIIVSGVGLLENIIHPGGVYTGQTFSAVAAEIIGGAFAYTVAPAVANQQVYGWLPYATARANLHQLLFALGVALRKDAVGEPTFVFLGSDTVIPVSDSRIAVGGTVNYETSASGVEITEHAYIAQNTDEEVILFDNSSTGLPANNATVVFEQAPIHDLTVTGTLTIVSQHPNYAVVSGSGTLTGKLYTHSTRSVSLAVDPPPTVENIKRVTDMTLISVLNSTNVARRVLAYYSSAETVRAKVVIEGEQCGDVLSMHDPYYDQITAFLAQADVNASSNLLGNCLLIEGYTPTGQGNNASGSVTLTGNGTWTVPDDVTEITVILVGGGTGGTAGEAGQDGMEPQKSTSGNTTGIQWRTALSVAGGSGGEGGDGGNVYVLTMTVTPGQTFNYSCGQGGLGEVAGGAVAQAGGDTTFGTLSSASGAVVAGGYIDPISGDILAGTGEEGYVGGPGMGYDASTSAPVEAEPLIIDGISYYPGARGANREYSGSAGSVRYSAIASGGFGGGPAYGSNGNQGRTGNAYFSSGRVEAETAQGGDGADALPPPQTAIYGKGGAGGNGGGGGGAAGVPTTATSDDTSAVDIYVYLADRSSGGAGSNGGQGGDGCVRIYY